MKKLLIIAAFGMFLQLSAMPVFDKPVETEVCDQVTPGAIFNYVATPTVALEVTLQNFTTPEVFIFTDNTNKASKNSYFATFAISNVKHFYLPKLYERESSWRNVDNSILMKPADQYFKEPLPDIRYGNI